MKILVFSDSHNKLSTMEQAVARHSPGHILHLGDHEQDAKHLAKTYSHIPVQFVRGNCDLPSATPLLLECTIAGRRILLTHGHRYNVKAGYAAIYHMGQAAGADLLLFGHTHIPHYEQIDTMHALNPGSAAHTYALVQILGSELCCTLHSMSN